MLFGALLEDGGTGGGAAEYLRPAPVNPVVGCDGKDDRAGPLAAQSVAGGDIGGMQGLVDITARESAVVSSTLPPDVFS